MLNKLLNGFDWIFLIFAVTILGLILFQISNPLAIDQQRISLIGGCPANTLSQLQADSLITLSAISYCHKGDQDQSRIQLTLPVEILKDQQLMLAGYIGHPGIKLNVTNPFGHKSILDLKPSGLRWSVIPITMPDNWRTGMVNIELLDQSTNPEGWGGIGLAPRVIENPFPILALVLYHATIIILPIIAFILLATYWGIRDLTLITLTGFTLAGIFTYLGFWVWLLSPTTGKVYSVVFLLTISTMLLQLCKVIGSEAKALLRPLLWVAGLWAVYAVFLLAFGMAPFNLNSPLASVAIRFTHPLPMDNQLPYIFAQQLLAGHVASPMIGEWLSSDRPPLQTAYFLMSGCGLLPYAELHYQVAATLLQSLWIIGMWLVLHTAKLSRFAIFISLLLPMFSGFAFVHGLFTWPKLFPVVYLAGVLAILLSASLSYLKDWRVGMLIGAAAGLAMLCHAGSMFALLGLGITLLIFKRFPSLPFIASVCITGITILLSWNIYQKQFDPPGNRLLKWHLAGVKLKDSRSFSAALIENYSATTLETVVNNKLSNVFSMIGDFPAWIRLSLKATVSLVSHEEASNLKNWQFFNVLAALGLLAFIPLAALLVQKRNNERQLSLQFMTLCIAIAGVEVVLLFGPDGALIHQGALLLVCCAFMVVTLSSIAVSPKLAWLVVILHFAFTLNVYVYDSPAGGTFSFSNPLWLLSLLAFLGTIRLLWQSSGLYNNSQVQRPISMTSPLN